MKVAVYSGSFNPLHIGHKAIIRHLTETAGFDSVYLIVSPKNPLKDTISEDSGPARFEAARNAVSRYPSLKVRVDDIELHMPAPNYSIKTLDALKLREPENKFTIVMGADNLFGIRKWKDYSRILSEYGAAVFPREGYDIREIKKGLEQESKTYHIQIVDVPLVNVSSTQIREAMARGLDVSDLLM